MATYSALNVSRCFNRLHRKINTDAEEQLTFSKLQKLLYYAEGCSLALGNGSLFSEEIYAQKSGSVIQGFEEQRIADPCGILFCTDEEIASFAELLSNKKDIEILEEVFLTFGQYSSWALTEKICNETPWLAATRNGTLLNVPIDRNCMEEYFWEHYVDYTYVTAVKDCLDWNAN